MHLLGKVQTEKWDKTCFINLHFHRPLPKQPNSCPTQELVAQKKSLQIMTHMRSEQRIACTRVQRNRGQILGLCGRLSVHGFHYEHTSGIVQGRSRQLGGDL